MTIRRYESIRLAELEAIVAEKLSQPYKPGERLWMKAKNRDYWRFPLERDGTIWSRRRVTI